MSEKEIEFEDQESEEEIEISIPKDQRVRSNKSDTSIYDLYRLHQKGRLNLKPDFQRMQVWDNKRSSRLIESVLLGIPIPLIYLNEEENNVYSVIDGQQRLTTFFNFMKSIFKLTGLSILSDLNGKQFNELPEELQNKVEDTTIPVITISSDSDPNVKFDIFERLNTGSMQLNSQELRNSIYRGPFNDLIKELASYPDFLKLLGFERPPFRMQDVELVLRFFAFFHETYLNYTPSAKRFLNKEMEEHKNINKNTEGQDLVDIFKKSVDLTKTIFGEKAFHRFVAGTNGEPNGHFEDKINRGLFDVIMYGFTRYQKNEIIKYSDIVKETMISMMVNDQEFINSISGSGTDRKEKVTLRFERWLKALENITKDVNKNESRTFSWSYKKQLWDTNPVCALCNQKIQTIDDAEVDHIEPYSIGGNTSFANARLVHRYCNRSRSKSITKEIDHNQSNSISPVSDTGLHKNSRAYYNKISNGIKTNQQEFRLPILKSLIELGGKGTTKEVLKKVELEMKNTLKQIDYDKVSNGSARWENTAQWERFSMKEDGLLSSKSPRGIWEITDKGRQFFAEHKDKF